MCSCLHILGMPQDTLKWKIFLFSLTGIAQLWYTRNVESAQGEWEVLQAKFSTTFFPISPIVQLHLEVLHFKQKEKETLGAA